MKGLTSADGKMTGNVQTVGRYNDTKKPKASGGESGGVHEPGGHDEIKSVVGEHGSAHTVITKKGPAGHHSTSHHEDGHVHEQDHDTIDDASEHMKTAMDGENADMEDESGDRAGERSEVESVPKHRAPSYME